MALVDIRCKSLEEILCSEGGNRKNTLLLLPGANEVVRRENVRKYLSENVLWPRNNAKVLRIIFQKFLQLWEQIVELRPPDTPFPATAKVSPMAKPNAVVRPLLNHEPPRSAASSSHS
jgi:hypothetical protein